MNRFKQIEAKLPATVADAVNDAAERIAHRAKAAAPVGKTGDLKKSIGTRPNLDVGRGGTGTQAGVTAAWYWFLVEFGHEADETGARGPARPHPFMVPAAEAERENLVRDISNRLQKL